MTIADEAASTSPQVVALLRNVGHIYPVAAPEQGSQTQALLPGIDLLMQTQIGGMMRAVHL